MRRRKVSVQLALNENANLYLCLIYLARDVSHYHLCAFLLRWKVERDEFSPSDKNKLRHHKYA